MICSALSVGRNLNPNETLKWKITLTSKYCQGLCQMLLCQFLMHSFQHCYTLILADTTKTQVNQGFRSISLLDPSWFFSVPGSTPCYDWVYEFICLSASNTNSLLRHKVAFCSVSNLRFLTYKMNIVIVSSQHRASHIKKSLMIFNISGHDFFFNKLHLDMYAFSQKILASYFFFWSFDNHPIRQQSGPNYFLKDQDNAFSSFISTTEASTNVNKGLRIIFFYLNSSKVTE